MSSDQTGFTLYKLMVQMFHMYKCSYVPNVHLWYKCFCNPFNGVMATKVQELNFKAWQLRLSTANSWGNPNQCRNLSKGLNLLQIIHNSFWKLLNNWIGFLLGIPKLSSQSSFLAFSRATHLFLMCLIVCKIFYIVS